jgi:hypothetical protein
VSNITDCADPIQPIGIWAYLDKVRLWPARPLTKQQIAQIRSACDHLYIGDPRFQSLQVARPKATIIPLLGEARISYAEFALELTFRSDLEKERATEFVNTHHVKSHHRQQGIRFVQGVTRYSGPRTAPNLFVTYDDRPSKETGEVHCLRLERRIRGSRALTRQGFSTISEILSVDHREFWQKRLNLYGVNKKRLGRLYHNAVSGQRRRRTVAGLYGDRYLGEIITRGCGRVTQQVVDLYQQQFNVRASLKAIPAEAYLPKYDNGRVNNPVIVSDRNEGQVSNAMQ